MPDLITLAIPAFLVLLFAETIAGGIMRRDIYEVKNVSAGADVGR
jgi:hypothetical protein